MYKEHEWTAAEDYNACLHYLWCVFDSTLEDGLEAVSNMLHSEMPHISPLSVRSKLKSIKAIAIDVGLEDHLAILPAKRYSAQCKRAFVLASDAYGALKDKYDGGKSGLITREELMDTLWLEIESPENDEEVLFSDDELMNKFTYQVTAQLKELKEKK